MSESSYGLFEVTQHLIL